MIGTENELYLNPSQTSNYSVVASYGTCDSDTAEVTVHVYENIQIELELDVDVYANLPYIRSDRVGVYQAWC